MAILKGQIGKILGVGRATGFEATRAVRGLVYGTRPEIRSTASNALAQETAIGTSLHSVWQGPLKKKRGRPALKRQRSA
jgi:hypothetical protein